LFPIIRSQVEHPWELMQMFFCISLVLHLLSWQQQNCWKILHLGGRIFLTTSVSNRQQSRTWLGNLWIIFSLCERIEAGRRGAVLKEFWRGWTPRNLQSH
jgi:hypothetical protein